MGWPYMHSAAIKRKTAANMVLPVKAFKLRMAHHCLSWQCFAFERIKVKAVKLYPTWGMQEDIE